MSRIKLVVTDVDGTLVTTEKALRPSAVAAVHKLHTAGIGFTFCSSRPPFGLTTMRDALQVTLPFGGYNGGAIVEPDLTLIEQVCIPPEVARKAVDTFHANGVSTWVFVGNEWVILDRNGDHVDHEIHTIDWPPTVVDHYTDYHFSAVGKIVGASNDHDLIAKVEHIMKETLGHAAHAARSQPYYCDVIAPGIDKGRIVALLGGRLGIATDEIAVLGDMTNDLEMFAAAGFPIAMGNAPDHVKAAAKGVAPDTNDGDGWARAIDEFILA
ncbi:MAG TPA: Cof-type HAD-IIB family hydrolase [Stellaceae bacterium]|nr:Cof-type HAD-IIB family hydrolase [Stellaceae bacterium]